MNTSILAEELVQLNAQIERTRQKQGALEGELRVVEAELEAFSADRQRFDSLREVCNALDKLGVVEAAELFWEGVAEPQNITGHLERVRSRVARFEEGINGILEKQAALRGQINRCLDELNSRYEEVRDAYAREERRRDEYVVEREISSVPHRVIIMPWSKDAESERRFRRALLVALLFFFCFSTLIRLWVLPAPVRPIVAVVPERLVSLLRKEPPKPEPVPERTRDKKKELKKDQEKIRVQEPLERQPEIQPQPAPSETQIARKKAESAGVLAFDFADLMDEIPVASLGVEARLNKDAAMAAGQAQAQRSLVAMQEQGGGSGGIGNAGVSRNVGSGFGGGSGIGSGGSGAGVGGNSKGIGGVGIAPVVSAVTNLVAEEGRPVSDGPGPARTDEEIQIVFDRYKAALYRIYNKELRKNPTLRGKMLMRISIEPGGEVSMCKVESTDLDSPELVAQIVERVQKFNFGPKEGVPKTTILYPIDFLPAG